MTKQIIFILLLLILCGCKVDVPIPVITQNELFEIGEEEYYILIEQDDCSGCEKVKPDASRYHQSTLVNSKLPKIYLLDISDPVNKDIISKDKTDIIEGATSIEELKITRTPTLIIIKNQEVIGYYINSSNVGLFLEEILPK
ncbi:MAG: hypothetical protein PHX62_00350 [Bacilli bacterium]|nr:hypothetical protein [Bacilli bacterium]